MDTPPLEDYQDTLARIERAVDQGDTRLSRLGFWDLVKRIKADPLLSEHWAETAGRIDRKAAERRLRFRVPVWAGNALMVLATAVLVSLVPLALALARRSAGPEALPGLLLVAAAGGLSISVHDPAHWAVGRLAGIRFLFYFVGGPLRVTPGLKVDYGSYLRTSAAARARMHAAGALASKAAPFAVFAGAYLPHARAGYDLLPAWSLWVVLGIGVGQIVTDLLWSRKVSDWMKVGRELRAGRAQRDA